MNKVELRSTLLATSSAAALIFGFAQSAQASSGCDQNNVSPPINNTSPINCISFNNEQGGSANGNFSGATTFTGNVTNSGTITPTGVNQNYPAGLAGTDAGISVIGLGVKLVGNITNSGTITGANTQYAGINIGGGGGGSGAPGATLQGSITNAATISGIQTGIIVSGVGTVVTGSVTNVTGASITNSTTAGGPGMSVQGQASIAGSLVNNGIINTGGTGLLESQATVGGNVSNGGSITIHNGFTAMALVNFGSVGGSVINTGTIVNLNASSNIGLWVENQTVAGSIINSGGITGGFGVAISGHTGHPETIGGDVTNTGSIVGNSAAGLIIDSATIHGNVSNHGTITGHTGGIVLSTSSTGLAATIGGAIINSGTINAKTGIALTNGATVVGGITNSGNITGSTAAIDLTGEGVATTITHSAGTISGNILLSNKSDTVNQTGGTIVGSIIGQASSGSINFTLGAGSQTFGPTTNITNVGTIAVNSGTLILNSTSNSDFATQINGGTLMIGDASHGTAFLRDPPAGGVTVAGGTLAGYGTIMGNVTNTGGMVAPGGTAGTIGTLHVTGNYSQSSGGTYVIEVNPTTASKLVVSGNATLAGNVKVIFDPGTYSAVTYDVLHATTISGSFNGTLTTTGTAPGITTSVSETTTDVDVGLTGSGSSGGSGGGGGGGATVTTNTTALGTSNNIALSGFFDSDDEIFDHLDEVGQASDNVKTALAARAPMQLAMNGPLNQVAQLGSAMPNMLSQYGGWVRGIGNFQSASTQGAVPGYSASGGGFLAGLDHKWGDWTVGAAAGYSGINFSQKDGSTGDIQTPRVMAYARFHASPQIVIDGIAGFAYDSIHTSRPIAALGANAVENHNGTEENLALQAGYELPWQGLTVIPRIGAQYLHLSQNGYSESGASGFDLAAPSSRIDSFQPIFSIAALQAFTLDSGMRVTPELKVAYSHEMLNTSPVLALTTPAGSLVTGTALSPARDTISVGPQVTLNLSNQLSVYADYKAIIGIGKSLANIVFAGARWNF